MGMDDAYKMINQTLVSLINEIWELEEKAIITDELPDMHTLHRKVTHHLSFLLPH